VTMLTLNRLGRRERTALVEQIAGTNALPDAVLTRSQNAPRASRCLSRN
jgi:hypothetical protein